jgi:hypothetical protein
MSVGAALYDRLSNFAGLSALVSTRIYPVLAPQSVTLPYLVYERISGTRIRALTSDTDLAHPRYQFTAFSSDYDESYAIIKQVRLALQRYSGIHSTTSPSVTIVDCTIETETDLYDPQTELHQHIIDFSIWHRE